MLVSTQHAAHAIAGRGVVHVVVIIRPAVSLRLRGITLNCASGSASKMKSRSTRVEIVRMVIATKQAICDN